MVLNRGYVGIGEGSWGVLVGFCLVGVCASSIARVRLLNLSGRSCPIQRRLKQKLLQFNLIFCDCALIPEYIGNTQLHPSTTNTKQSIVGL